MSNPDSEDEKQPSDESRAEHARISDSVPDDPTPSEFAQRTAQQGNPLLAAESDESHDTIDAEIARAEPVRYGIKAMALLTLIAALVFGLISLTGPLVGLFVSFCLSAVALGVFFFVGIVKYRTFTSESLAFNNSVLVRLGLLTTVLFFGAIFAGGGEITLRYLGKIAAAQEISAAMGFEATQIDNYNNFEESQHCQVETIFPGGEFEKSGILVGDVILNYDFNELFETLQNSQGERIDLEVANAPFNQPIATDVPLPKQRVVTITVPEF